MRRPERGPRITAHRGASAHAPEHTLAAYDLALEQGADALELDVRTTADGVLVVLHDPTLARTCGDPRRVDAVTAAELDGGPLRLDDVLDRYRDTALLVEVKDAPPAAVLDAVDRAGARGSVVVQSFDRRLLRALRALDPTLPLAPLYRERCPSRTVRRDLARAERYAGSIGPAAARIDAPLVLAAHARGLTVRAWTVNDPAEAERLVALGVDELVTDSPATLRPVADAARPVIRAAGAA